MTENQILALLYVFSVILRVPRIVERWRAPLLRGEAWFFNVSVPRDFLNGAGALIQRDYRLRLFRPWAVELPVLAALVVTGNQRYVVALIFVLTLATRLNFYAARRTAEVSAQRFALPEAGERVSAVALSMRRRTLADYTSPWIEAVIAMAIGASLGWMGYRYSLWHDWAVLRGSLAATAIVLYFQVGLVLLKRAFVRARTVAPADNAEQYMAWRDSLRRLSTAMCDYARILFAFSPLLVDLRLVTNPWQGSAAQTATIIVLLAGGLAATWYEWHHRLLYLQVARQTRPAKYLVRRDLEDVERIVCFRPTVPMLLLNGPKGYTLNLASAAVRRAGLYLAGYAALWVCLTR